MLLFNATTPKAELSVPVVLFTNASLPTAVLKLPDMVSLYLHSG